MNLLVDMNLSPSWVGRLAGHGFEAVHWSTIGAATAPDVEILAWANEHRFVVITNDLDFSAILAASSGATPSVVQIRTQDLLSDGAVSIIAKAMKRIARTSSEARSCRSTKAGHASGCCLCATRGRPRNPCERARVSCSPGGSAAKIEGTTRLRAVGPLLVHCSTARGLAEVITWQMDSEMFFAMNEFGPLSDGRRLSPPMSCERGRRSSEETSGA